MKFVAILLFLYACIYLLMVDLNKPSRIATQERGTRGSGQNGTLFLKIFYVLLFFSLKYYLIKNNFFQ